MTTVEAPIVLDDSQSSMMDVDEEQGSTAVNNDADADSEVRAPTSPPTLPVTAFQCLLRGHRRSVVGFTARREI